MILQGLGTFCPTSHVIEDDSPIGKKVRQRLKTEGKKLHWGAVRWWQFISKFKVDYNVTCNFRDVKNQVCSVERWKWESNNIQMLLNCYTLAKSNERNHIIQAKFIITHTHTFQSSETRLKPFLCVCFTCLQNAGAAAGAVRRKEWNTWEIL